VPRIHRCAQDYIRTLSNTRTQKQIADLLGISERTVRRYKRGDTQPHDKEVIQRIETSGRKEVRKQLRQGYLNAPVPKKIPSMRRQIPSTDPDTGKRILVPSQWLNYEVDGLSWRDMHYLIKHYVKRGIGWHAQISGLITPGLDFSKENRIGTEVTNLWPKRHPMTDLEITQFINSFLWVEYSGEEEDDTKRIPNRPLHIGFIFKYQAT
jgi:transcriptional regulator with XRE-family HTH domain